MIPKTTVKLIKSLHIKKYRVNEQLFLVEGKKNILELANSDFHIHFLVSTPEFFKEHGTLLGDRVQWYQCGETELTRLSVLEHNNTVLAVVRQHPVEEVIPGMKGKIVLALDDIRDPGNLGTILRIADWYGIRQVIASSGTSEFYNPKVIQASMGSFTRVKVCYTDLEKYLKDFDGPVMGTFMEGENIHESTSMIKEGIIVFGNEARGISPALIKHVDKKVTIPRYGQAESLNVAISCAIVLDNIKRWANE